MRSLIDDFPHQVVVSLGFDQYSNMVEWMGQRGLKPRETVFFGSLSQGRVNSLIHQSIYFRCRTEALLFKLTWGGI